MRRRAGFSRETSDQWRFMVPSWPEAFKLVDHAVTDLEEHIRDIPVDGETKLKRAHLVNSVLIWFLSRPRSEQIEIARAGRKATEWLRKQGEIPEFQRFDMDVILPAYERLKDVLGDHDRAGFADLAYQSAADRKKEGKPSLRVSGDDATRQHAITNDDNKKRFELTGETGIDAESKPVYKQGRSVTQKVRQPRRKGIA